jgi:hypothetical protein
MATGFWLAHAPKVKAAATAARLINLIGPPYVVKNRDDCRHLKYKDHNKPVHPNKRDKRVSKKGKWPNKGVGCRQNPFLHKHSECHAD